MAAASNALVRIRSAWRALAPEQRMAALAAVCLLLSMFLPWYEKNVVADGRLITDSISAFGVLSFIEAAIFLVSAGVLMLLFFRAERRAFHLPGGDGTIVFAAGLWTAFLLFVRVFSRPEIQGDGGTVGIQWGFFIAFVAAGWLAYAGWRMRVAARAEPTPAQDPTVRVDPAATIDHVWPERTRTPAPSRRRTRPEDPTRIAGQLSLGEDDEPPAPPTWNDPPRRS